jgi:hypothetical protein
MGRGEPVAVPSEELGIRAVVAHTQVSAPYLIDKRKRSAWSTLFLHLSLSLPIHPPNIDVSFMTQLCAMQPALEPRVLARATTSRVLVLN